MPSSETKPTFGQVWSYTSSHFANRFMLIARVSPFGHWKVVWLDSGLVNIMYGLYDDPDTRIAGYTLLRVESE